MENESAFEKEAKRQKAEREESAIKILDALSKECKGCDCPRYSELEMTLALTIIDAMDTFKEIGGLLPKHPTTKEEGKS